MMKRGREVRRPKQTKSVKHVIPTRVTTTRPNNEMKTKEKKINKHRNTHTERRD